MSYKQSLVDVLALLNQGVRFRFLGGTDDIEQMVQS